MLEKEKLLKMSNFSFSHSVFYPFVGLSTILIKFIIVVHKLIQFGRAWNLLYGKATRWRTIKNCGTSIYTYLVPCIFFLLYYLKELSSKMFLGWVKKSFFYFHQQFLTLSQTTNFTLFQIERVCRRQFWTWWKWQKVLQAGKKHYGKMRNCSLWAISPFPTMFQKTCTGDT